MYLGYVYAFLKLILHILSFNYTHCSSIRENYTFHFYNQILKTEHFRLVFVLIIIFLMRQFSQDHAPL